MIVPLGMSYQQADCWELVELIYRSEVGIELGNREDQIIDRRIGDWVEVTGEPRTLDVLLFSDGPLNKHVGVYLDKGRFVHTLQATGVCVSNCKSAQWKDRLRKIYRHRQLLFEAA